MTMHGWVMDVLAIQHVYPLERLMNINIGDVFKTVDKGMNEY